MFGFDNIGEFGVSSGPAISGANPVFQVASEQPTFLGDKPFFAQPKISTSNVALIIAGVAVVAVVGYAVGKISKG